MRLACVVSFKDASEDLREEGSDGSTNFKPCDVGWILDSKPMVPHIKVGKKVACHLFFSSLILLLPALEVKDRVSSKEAVKTMCRSFNPLGHIVAEIVKCTICTRIEKQAIIICMKKDHLNKHARWKCTYGIKTTERVMKRN